MPSSLVSTAPAVASHRSSAPPLTPQTHELATIIDLMTELNRDLGTTMVLVTHDLDLAGRARRTIRLADGSIVGDTAA